MNERHAGLPIDRRSELTEQGTESSIQGQVADVPGSPTWPITTGERQGAAARTGLGWDMVAESSGIDRRILEHDGSIVVQGDYFIESGYLIDPQTMRARHVDVGDRALRPGYFVSDLTVSEFGLSIPVDLHPVGSPVAPPPISGPIIGLFTEEAQAGRARQRLLDGSLAAEIQVEPGVLGTELHVGRAWLPGRVATVIAAHGGSVVSIDGRPISEFRGPIVSRSSLLGGTGLDGRRGDARRPGTGVTSGSPGPEISNRETEVRDGQEFTPW